METNMQRTLRWVNVVGLTFFVVVPTTAWAQVIGVFRWQLAPFCNVVTLTVEQKGLQYALTGFDDMCGGARRGAATGLAQPNPDGTIGFGITVVRPDGLAVQHSAAISLATLSGTWSDDYGNGGSFLFSVSTATGSPRPLTLKGVYSVNGTPISATPSSTLARDSISFGRSLPFTPQARVVVSAGTVPECPGTAQSPAAAPGFLCVYERFFSSRITPITVHDSTGNSNTADRVGAIVLVFNSGAAVFGSSGTWAVTVP
jgi:hypothetical protein